MMDILFLGYTVIACLLLYAFLIHSRRKTLRLPPGPRPIPLLGNILDMPTKHEWKTFYEWSHKYGDIVYVTLIGRPIILLNTVEAATNLLMTRSGNYSERPSIPLLELVGHLTFNFGFMPYGHEWHSRRKIFTSQYNKANLSAFHDSYKAVTMQMLRGFQNNSGTYANHFRLLTAQLMLDITYGIKIDSLDDRLAKVVQNVLDTVSLAVSPKMLLINPLPLIRVLPAWVKKILVSSLLATWSQDVQDLLIIPFERTKADISEGVYNRSFVSDLLQKIGPENVWLNEGLIRDAAATAFGGGSDTIISASSTFLLAMALYPNVQEKARQEIDAVVGSDRLPNVSDRAEMPFISAIVKEILRWHPPAPLGIPHALKEDDCYEGFCFPAGTIVIGNIWGILHDAAIFEDPLEFRPERFIGLSTEESTKMDLLLRIAFGFGRRICPGMLLADEMLWLIVAQFLAVYTISPDPHFPPSVEFTSGAISEPLPFRYKLDFRSEQSRSLLESD